MKKERKIQLVTDDFPEPPGEELAGEQAEIDALLRAVADDCSAEIDFEGIKQRAVESAKAKKAKRGRIRRALGYGMAAAASLIVGFVAINALRNAKLAKNSAFDANAGKDTTQYAAENTKNNPDSQQSTKRIEVGAVSSAEYRAMETSSDILFPNNLPESMERRSGSSTKTGAAATGTDKKGGSIDYECCVEKGRWGDLKVGEACSVRSGEKLLYYWQINENSYLEVSFTGFDEQYAEAMFKALANQLTDQPR